MDICQQLQIGLDSDEDLRTCVYERGMGFTGLDPSPQSIGKKRNLFDLFSFCIIFCDFFHFGAASVNMKNEIINKDRSHGFFAEKSLWIPLYPGERLGYVRLA